MVKNISPDLTIKNKIETYQHIKVAAFRKDIRKTDPHKHNSYVEFVLLTQGSGSHTIDGKCYPVKPPVFFTIKQEQVHHWDLEGDPDGYVMIIKKQFVDDSLDKALKELLANISAHACLYLASAQPYRSLLVLLLQEWERFAPYRADIIDGLLKAMIAKVLQASQAVLSKHSPPHLYSQFEELLGNTLQLRNSVAHYAHLLNTTPQNLNIICRKTSNQSAASVLATHLVGEAKRLLRYTDKTVNQIATQLRFKNGSHFIKYFKRHVGCTPQVFRKPE